MTQTTTPTNAPTESESTTPVTPEDAETSVTARFDRLSLEQALIDVEVANARVIDLTARLTESHLETRRLREQIAVRTAPTRIQPALGSRALGLRAVVAGPARAVARRLLPLSVRTRLRSLLG